MTSPQGLTQSRPNDLSAEAIGWRRHLHQTPELGFDLPNTAAFVAARLREFGCDEIVEGIARTGIVALIHGRRGPGRTIGLRSDMDALPILEASGKDWQSTESGKMHACGHDGHMAMLLGAAKALAASRDFAGTVAVIFQPAEENGGGGRVMVQEGMIERFGIDYVYGMHNEPGVPVGQFSIRPGAMMAGTAEFDIAMVGQGGHAAQPNKAIDPVIMTAALIQATQTIVSRSTDPLHPIVVSITSLSTPVSHNVIPAEVALKGTIRAFDPVALQDAIDRLGGYARSIAEMHGGSARVDIRHGYPITFNAAAQTDVAISVARQIAGAEGVETDATPKLGAEDFSFMLNERPGSMIMIGNGDTAQLHNPGYDFSDDTVSYGIDYWCRLVDQVLNAPAPA